MMILENDDAVRTIQKDDTFSCTDAFVSDMLTFHDHRFLSQPNAVYSEGDCRGQMAVKTLLRVLSHVYTKRELRDGPFLLQLYGLPREQYSGRQRLECHGLIGPRVDMRPPSRDARRAVLVDWLRR